MTGYDPQKRVLIEETFQIYKVGMAPEHGSDWCCEVRAPSFHSAVLKAAEMAHGAWAWEASWPLPFIVTDQGGRSRLVEVDREIVPRYAVRAMREVGGPCG
jgi:hypothetical protein